MNIQFGEGSNSWITLDPQTVYFLTMLGISLFFFGIAGIGLKVADKRLTSPNPDDNDVEVLAIFLCIIAALAMIVGTVFLIVLAVHLHYWAGGWEGLSRG